MNGILINYSFNGQIRMKQTILNCISLKPGIGAIQLALDVMSYENPCLFDSDKYEYELQSLIESGEIYELEYTRIEMEYRIKSIFFPKTVEFINLESLISLSKRVK